MHWLPLVAMVIASALFFLRYPSVPRLADTLMEPGNISTRSRLNPNSNRSHSEYNGTHSGGDNVSSFTSKDLFSDGSRGEEDRIRVRSQSPKLQTSFHFQKSQTATDQRLPENPEEAGTKDSGLKGSNVASSSVSVESFMLEQQLREASIKAPRGNQDEVDQQGTSRGMMPAVPAEGKDISLESLLEVNDELMLVASHPRVLFSTSPTPPKQPPLPIMLESGFIPEDLEGNSGDMETTSVNTERPKQPRDGESYRNLLLGISDSSTLSKHRRRRQLRPSVLERSVCESVSNWVMDRRTAIDTRMRNVTVFDKFPTKKGQVTQFFYETRCRGPDHRGARSGEHGIAGGGCLGVDKRYWVSECQTKQTFVRAFTSDTINGPGWRWIRIDSACVCVLYLKAHKNHRLLTGRGNR